MRHCNIHVLVIRAWRIARLEGWHSLIDRAVCRWLPTLHAHLPCGFGSLHDILRWLKEHNDYRVYSFDVFDTLLRRRIDPPELIKRLVAEHISELMARCGMDVAPEQVLARRYEAEHSLQQEAVSRGNDADCRLDDVITEMLRAFKAANVLDIEDILDYEVALEKQANEPMLGARPVLSYLRSIGKRVICVSDSYLSPNQMAMILEHHGLLEYIDKLYVSSDVGMRKSTGRLFEWVIKNEGSKLVHVGDNYISDHIIPRSLAIKTLWFHSRSEQRRKSELQKLANGENKMNYVNAIVRGADGDDNALYRIGYEVFGPALTVFVHNVAEQARKDGVEAMFFVARDGYAMKKIYDILRRSICSGDDAPTSRYLCLSRFPVRAASMQKLTCADVSEVYSFRRRRKGEDMTFGDILRGLCLEAAEILTIAECHGIDIDVPLDDPTESTALRDLLDSTEFQKSIRLQTDRARRLLRQYLVSIGFMDKRSVAVVDGSSEGITRALLKQAFADDIDYPMVSAYYLNLLNIHKTNVDLDLSQVTGVFTDWRTDPRSEQGLFILFGMLVELFAHPNHGLTVGYREFNGRVVPIFKRTPQESQYHVTSKALRGMLAYARDYSKFYDLHNRDCAELLEHAKRRIAQWLAFPPKRDVQALVDLYIVLDWPYESKQRLVRQVDARDIATGIGLIQKLRSSLWPQGTLALTPVPGLSWLFFRAATFRRRSRKLAWHLAVFYATLAARTQRAIGRLN